MKRGGIFVFAMTYCGSANAATSLESLAAQVVNQLNDKLPPGSQVAIGKIATDQPITNADGLTTRIAEYLQSRIKDGTFARNIRDGGAARLARKPTVFLSPQLLLGTVSVTAQVFVPDPNVWVRAKEKENPLVAQTAAFSQADVELRQFLPPIALERMKLTSFSYDKFDDNDPPLAIACGELGGRGTLVIASRHEVRLGYLNQGQVQWDKKVKWVDIARRAAVPLREPIVSALFRRDGGHGSLWVGNSDRGGAVFDGKAWKAVEGLPMIVDHASESVWCANTRPIEHALSGVLTNCRGIEVPLVLSAHEMPLSQFGDRVLFRPAGGELSIRDPSGASIELEGAETGALSDLNQDGSPEVILSTNEPASIRIAVVSGQTVQQKVQLDVPHPVVSIAACPADVDARPSVLALTAEEVLRVR